MNLNFEEILLQPFRRIWAHKILLWLNLSGGLVTALLLFLPLGIILSLMQQETQPPPQGMIVLVIVVAALGGAASLLMRSLMRVITILAAQRIASNEELPPVGQLLRQAGSRLLPVIGLNLLLGLGSNLVIIPLALSIPLTAGVAALCAGPLMLVLTPVLWAVGGWSILSQMELTVHQTGVLESLRRGWASLRARWLGVLLLSFVITQISGLLVALPASLPFAGIAAILFAAAANPGEAGWLLPLLCLSASLPVVALAFALYSCFYDLAWFAAYRQITSQEYATI